MRHQQPSDLREIRNTLATLLSEDLSTAVYCLLLPQHITIQPSGSEQHKCIKSEMGLTGL